MPALSLYESCFIGPAPLWKRCWWLGKGSQGASLEGNSVHVLLGNALRLISEQEEQSGERKGKDTASMKKN